MRQSVRLPFGSPSKKPCGAEHHALHLGFADARHGAVTAAAVLDLDKDHHCALPQDQINLAAALAPAPGRDRAADAFIVARDQFLCRVACVMGLCAATLPGGSRPFVRACTTLHDHPSPLAISSAS